MGQMMNIKPHPLAPELWAWEVAAYQTMFERATQETGGRLRRDDLGTFLDYIGVRRRVRGVHRAPFAASEFFGQLLHTFALVADTDADLTEALGLVLTGSGKPYGKSNGPNNALGFHTKRCKRSAMFVDNGVVKVMQIAEAPDDPAGDDRPEVSCIENMLSLIGKL